jgi:hypothetical protein
VRAKAAPSPIGTIGMVKAAAITAYARVSRAIRRRTTARWTRLRSLRAPQGHTWTTSLAVPVAARIDPTLLLRRHKSDFEARLVEALRTRRIGFWWMPDPVGGRVLCLADSERASVLDLIAGLAGPAWYLDTIGADGARAYRYELAAGARGGPYLAAPGLLLWEFVTAHDASTFVANEEQGVTLYFWRPAGDRLICRVGNLVAHGVHAVEVAESGSSPTDLQAPPSSVVDFPIDVVYTWVDGEENAWLRAKAEAAELADPDKFTERAHDDSRFADHDELRFSLRALEQYAPWVNHVWIVTARQRPAWLDPDNDWVSVVDHSVIWPDERGLPTFNSHAIEACLHRIPGLAEHFVYLNDDMLIGRPIGPETFFHSNGIGRFFQSRALVPLGPPQSGEIASSTAAKNARRLIRERYGVTFTRKFFHTGAPLTVSGLAELEATFPDVVDATRRAQFRTVEDVAMAGSFYLNWAYVVGRSVPGAIRYTYIDPAVPEARGRLRTVLKRRPFDALCINDGTTEQTVQERRETDRLIRDFFSEYLPVKGRFELS